MKRSVRTGSRASGAGRRGFGLLPLLALSLVAGVAAALIWTNVRDDGGPDPAPATVGEPVPTLAAPLEDSRTGQPFSISSYLGEKEIVIVSYMGEF